MNLDLMNEDSVRSKVPQKIAKSSGPEGMNLNVQRAELWPVCLDQNGLVGM